MPMIRIEMLEGRSEDKKNKMLREVTEAMARALEIDEEEVDIIVYEIKKKDWSTGGISWDR